MVFLASTRNNNIVPHGSDHGRLRLLSSGMFQWDSDLHIGRGLAYTAEDMLVVVLQNYAI